MALTVRGSVRTCAGFDYGNAESNNDDDGAGTM